MEDGITKIYKTQLVYSIDVIVIKERKMKTKKKKMLSQEEERENQPDDLSIES